MHSQEIDEPPGIDGDQPGLRRVGTSIVGERREELYQYSLAQYALLSLEQKRVIYRFLKFFAEHAEGWHDDVVAQEAIDKHWHQYTNDVA